MRFDFSKVLHRMSRRLREKATRTRAFDEFAQWAANVDREGTIAAINNCACAVWNDDNAMMGCSEEASVGESYVTGC